MGKGARFGRDRRIRKSAEFALVLKEGRRATTSLASVAVRPGAGRIGISASVKIGGSVQRNRARRLVREYYRQSGNNPAPYDMVFNLKPGFADLSLDEVRRVLDEVLSRAIQAGRVSRRSPGPGN